MNSTRKQHNPVWPGYTAKPENRSLALYEKGRVYFENGKSSFVNTANDLLNTLFDENVLLFTSEFTGRDFLPYLDYCVHSDSSRVLCSKHANPLCIRVRNRRATRWISLASHWDVFPDFRGIKFIRSVHNMFGCHSSVTPGALSHQHMRKVWHDFKLPSQVMLSMGCQEYLIRHRVGGRNDTPGLGKFYDEAIELDMKIAYPAHYGLLQPTGAGIPFVDGFLSNAFKVWFAKCEVFVSHTLPLGPFPVREKEKVKYPTEPGRYTTYIWNEQAAACEQAGCRVKVISGWGWTTTTDINQKWVEEVYRIRQSSDTDKQKAAAKVVANAGIGKHATGFEKYFLVPGRSNTLDPVLMSVDGEPLIYDVASETKYNSVSMIHWALRAWNMTSLDLYLFALPYAQTDSLIMTDTDSVVVLEKYDEKRRYVKRYSIEEATLSPGSWRWMQLHNVSVNKSRTLDCDEYSKRPGVPDVRKTKFRQSAGYHPAFN